jgi:uncharacterized protein YbaR (Trm112 family)
MWRKTKPVWNLWRIGRCSSNAHQFDNDLLNYLACPLSKDVLQYSEVDKTLRSPEMGAVYTIDNGIPILNPHKGRLQNQNAEHSEKVSNE